MKKIAFLLLIIVSGCNGKVDLDIMEQDPEHFSLVLRGEGIMLGGIMSYFEDLDLLQDRPARDDALPHAFDTMLTFIRPYVKITKVERLKGNQLRYYLEIDDLILFQQRFAQDGYQLIQFYQDQSGMYHLRLEMSSYELNRLYETMTMLPKVPSNWSRANRKNYIQQVANIFGSTKNERARLEQELDQASIKFLLTTPSNSQGVVVKNASGLLQVKGNRVEITINVMDFLTGHDYIEVQWS